MKTIPLTKGFFTKVDDEDYERLAGHRWYAAFDKYKGKVTGVRAARSIRVNGKHKTQFMARLLLPCPSWRYVDHINGDALDNRKANLRVCTKGANVHNSSTPSNNTSGYKGVSRLSANSRRWRAYINPNRKQIHLGTFSTPEAAASAYNKAAKKYFGSFARLNKI